MEDNYNTEQEKRELRRRRRKKNELISYLVVFVVVAALTAGGIYLGMTLYRSNEEKLHNEEVIQQIQEEIAAEDEPEEIILTEPETEPEVLIPSKEELIDQVLDPVIAEMTLEEKVAGLFIVTPESITGVDTATMAGDGTKTAIEKYPVGGMIYFSKNITGEDQLVEMISKTASYNKYPMFFAVDEEGGDVARVGNSKISVEKPASQQEVGETGDATNAYASGIAMGTYLSKLGFNLDLAPVADVASVEKSYIGNRSFGSDFTVVADFVVNEVKGLEENGVSACLKHFPGIGSTTGDTHDTMVASERTSAELKAEEFTVFQAGIDAGADFIMVSHVALPSITGDNTPSSLTASVVTDLLRNELGYNGIVITDSLSMGAISEYYAADEAAVMALRAGCDMLLMPENFELAYNGVITAVNEGKIDEKRIDDALKRIYTVKYKEQVETELAKYY